MMVEFRWIKMSLFLIAVLQFTAAAEKLPLSFTVGVGDEVTLPCENVIDGQQKCGFTTWIFSGSGSSPAVTLVEFGQIHKEAENKSGRLGVTANCSLVIKKVTVEDVGRYTCRQFISGQEEGEDSQVDPSVINSEDSITTTTKPTTTTENSLTAGTTTTASATNDASTELRGDTQTTTTKSTTTTEDSTAVTTTTATNETSIKLQGWWWLIILFVGVTALLIIVVAVIGWKRSKGKKTQMDENTADPEDGVSYASLSYTKKSNSKARVRGKDDDEYEAGTYSTVKVSSSSAGASADPSDLYTTINKPNK